MADPSPQHEAILEQRFARTESGEETLLGAGRLQRRHATVLRLLDGRMTGSELATHLRNFDLPTILSELQTQGLIEGVAHAGGPWSTRSRWRLFGRRDRQPAESPEPAPEEVVLAEHADADVKEEQETEAPAEDDSRLRLRSYLNAELDEDDITDIMGTQRNV